jgi:DNA-binding NarL/FixJ family response regulator
MVVDDNPVVRAGLVALLEIDEGIEVAGEAADGRRAVDLAGRLRPDLVLLDVRMPLVDGVEAARLLSRFTQVLMLSYTDDPVVIRSAIRNGAVGYLIHGSFAGEDLAGAVRDAVSGTSSPLSPAASRAVVSAIHDSVEEPGDPRREQDTLGLSARETDVMDLIAQGHSNGDIARLLVLSEKTVKNHVNRIYAKLGVQNRAAAVAHWLGTAGNIPERSAAASRGRWKGLSGGPIRDLRRRSG